MNFPAATFLILNLLSSFAFAFNIVIDPGHGGSDKGAFRGSFVESEIVFKIAQKLKTELEQKSNVSIYFTRTNERGMSLKERVELAHEKDADLFLSLHANSSTSSQVTGMEYYFGTQKNAPVFLKSKNSVPLVDQKESNIINSIQSDLIEFGKTKQSLEFSKTIQTAWAANEFGKKQGSTSKIRRAPFYVIENTRMPAVLVEVGFISNQREARKLVTDDYQNELAHALTAAVLEFKEKSDK
jgi:N-acetylmuramoyl-L-alanine amidase